MSWSSVAARYVAATCTPGMSGQRRGTRLACSASTVSERRRNIRLTRMASAICSPSSCTSARSATLKCPSAARRARVSTPYLTSPSTSGTDSTEVASSNGSSGVPSMVAPSASASSACAMRAGCPDSCTATGMEPDGGSTAATTLVSSASRGSSGPVANSRRTRCLRSMSTMTQAVSSRAISRAQRCRVRDSLKPSFSSSSRATAVTRSSRRVTAWTAPSSGPGAVRFS